MELELNQPYYLLLIIPVGWLIYSFSKRAISVGLKNGKLISTMRTLLFISLILALSNPLLVVSHQKESVVFVVDQSYSMNEQSNEMTSFIQEAISHKDAQDEFSVVSVGEEARVENAMSSADSFSDFQATVPQENTNLEKGLRLASSLFQNEQMGRIVLLTDGLETEGNVLKEANLLRKKGYELDVASFSSLRASDLALVALRVPDVTFKGEQANATFQIDSTVDAAVRVRILINNEIIVDNTVKVQAGVNEFSFSHLVETEGYKMYEAELFYEDDQVSQNNRLTAVSYTEGPPKVLIVEGIFGEAANLSQALQAANVPLDVISSLEIPSTLTSLPEYETIIFSNVSATDVPEQKMDLIENAVKDYGKGFVMTGGEQSFGLGGYFDTPIEKVLPVDMDIKGKKEIPSLGLMIVVDRSGSMQGHKLELAKEAAARTVALLREKDTLGVIAFDDQPWEIVKAAPIEDKEAVEEKIRSISGGGGTSIYPALEKAYGQMVDSDAKRKHIILLTDGQSATTEDYYSLIENGLEENITLSTVSIGEGADRLLLQSLAEEGTGRFYDVVDASVIPSILSRETVMITRTYIEDEPFYPTITSMPIAGLNPVFEVGLPQMNAYIAVSPKSKAQTILMSEKEDPILSVWQYGIGRSAAFASDVTGKWSGDWPSWEKWQEFWLQLVNWTFPAFESEAFQMDVQKDGENVVVHLSTDEAIIDPLQASVTTNEGVPLDATIAPIRPGEYEVAFKGQEGIYFLHINKVTDQGHSPILQTGFSVRYSDEFLIEETDPNFFENFSSVTGGESLESAGFVFRPLETKLAEEKSMQIILLLFALFLLLSEVTIRRFGLSIPRFIPKRTKEKIPKQTFKREKDIIKTDEPVNSVLAEETKWEVKIGKPVNHEEKKNNRSSQMDRLLSAKNRKK